LNVKKAQVQNRFDSELVLFCAHTPPQIGCVGFAGRCRVQLPQIFSRNTGRNRARQVFSLLIASTISLTAKGNPPAKRVAEIHKSIMVIFGYEGYTI
jgi:hypothetical protein